MAKRKTAKTAAKTTAAEADTATMPLVEAPALDPGSELAPPNVEAPLIGEEAAAEPVAVSDAAMADQLDQLAAEFDGAETPPVTLAPEFAGLVAAESAEPAIAPEKASDNPAGASPVAAEARAHRRTPAKGWFSLTAASVALAAGLGVGAGVLFGPLLAQPAPARAVAATAPDPSSALQESVRLLAAEITSLKKTVASADSGSADALVRFTERLETAETVQGALVERVTRLADKLDASPATAVSSEITGSIEPAPAVASGWVLWRVVNGRALVQGNSGYYEVMAGSSLPGLGVVQKITRNDGRWVVMTQRGMIIPPRG